MSAPHRPGPATPAIVLCAPLGPAGIALLLTSFLPLLGLPAVLTWGAKQGIAVIFWGVLTAAIFAGLLGGNAQLRKFPEGATAVGRVVKGFFWILLLLILLFAVSMFMWMMLIPSGVIVGAVVLLGSPDGLPRGYYLHRVLSDLLLFYGMFGALIGGWALMRSWRDPAPDPSKGPPRWLRIALFAGLLLGALVLVWAGVLGRFDPETLAELFEPKLER